MLKTKKYQVRLSDVWRAISKPVLLIYRTKYVAPRISNVWICLIFKILQYDFVCLHPTIIFSIKHVYVVFKINEKL